MNLFYFTNIDLFLYARVYALLKYCLKTYYEQEIFFEKKMSVKSHMLRPSRINKTCSRKKEVPPRAAFFIVFTRIVLISTIYI